MSSRLLQMKFMQRAAASAASSPLSPQQPPSPHTPGTDADHSRPGKRPRLSDAAGSDAAADSPVLSRQQSRASLVEGTDEERRRHEEALERVGRERGETRWSLAAPAAPAADPEWAEAHDDGEARRFVVVGRGELDGRTMFTSNEDGEATVTGRMKFGRGPVTDTSADAGVDAEHEGDDTKYSAADVDSLVDHEMSRSRPEATTKDDRKRKRSIDLAKERRRKETKLKGGGKNRGGIGSGGSTPVGRRSYGGGGHRGGGGGGRKSTGSLDY